MDLPTRETSSVKVSFERERGVYGLTVIRDVAHLVVTTGDGPDRLDRILQVFRVMATANVPVFLVKMHRSSVTMALGGRDLAAAARALDATSFEATTRRDLALVAVRAASMRDLHGVIIVIADALFEAGAHILEIGDSHDSVQCLVEAGKISAAVDSLRSTFSLPQSAVHETSVEEEDGP